MKLTITKQGRALSGATWYVGTVGSYYFEALVFAEPSQYGIDGGQVSKLAILDRSRKQGGRELACYDRGWEVRPEEAGGNWREVQAAVEVIVGELSLDYA